MDAEAGVPFQPPLDPWCFVGAVIIDDQMNVQERQEFPVVPVQELDEPPDGGGASCTGRPDLGRDLTALKPAP